MTFRTLALSNHWLPRFLRKCRRAALNFGLPRIPRFVSLPLVGIFLFFRAIYYFAARVFFCEPFFKSYCTQYGRGVHTGVYFHWIQGRGDLILGDNVRIDGKCNFTFATRFCERPTLIIGDNSGMGHGCTFTVGKKITIGRHCRFAGQVWVFDSPGHPADAVARMAGSPPSDEEVKPVVIEDNVWVGRGAVIMPGVTLGEGSIVAAGAVVMADVPPYTLVLGNPARQIRKLNNT